MTPRTAPCSAPCCRRQAAVLLPHTYAPAPCRRATALVPSPTAHLRTPNTHLKLKIRAHASAAPDAPAHTEAASTGGAAGAEAAPNIADLYATASASPPAFVGPVEVVWAAGMTHLIHLHVIGVPATHGRTAAAHSAAEIKRSPNCDPDCNSASCTCRLCHANCWTRHFVICSIASYSDQ